MKNLKLVALLIFLVSQVFGQSALDDAKKEIDKENYVKARNILLKTLNDGSSDVKEVAYYLGNAYLKNDDIDSAKIFYRMVGGADNHQALGYLAYARLTLLNGNKAEAIKLFDKAAQVSRMKDSKILFQAGDALFRPTVTDLSAAIGYFEDAYKLDNKNYMNMLELGDAYLENNEGGKAMSKYESASELNPKLTLAFIKVGRLDINGRIYDDAIIAFQKAIALEPDYAVAHKELAEAYYRATKYDLAKPEFKKYIELNKDDADAKTKFLTFLFQIKQYEQCASESQSMLADDPANYLILRALFYSEYELKRYKEGMEAAQRFWVAAPTSKVKPFDYVEMAKLATKTGDTAVALKYFNTALSVDSNNADLLSDYGLLMYNTKRYYEAIATYSKRITNFPAPRPTFYDYYYLGRSYYSVGLSFKSKKDVTSKDSATYYFTATDSTFARLLVAIPQYVSTPDVWQWRAKANNNLDPEMKTGAAKPYYEGFIKLAEAATDQTRLKNFLLEAYQYLGAYYLNVKDTGAARGWLEKAKALEPENEITKELLKGL
jgi:tetratricopeptide (TPR) repeat protein